MYLPVEVVEVMLWGERIGAVAVNPRTGYCVFEYDRKWAAKGIDVAPFAMPLDKRGGQQFINLPEETYKRLPAMLADSLPDKFGNALLDAAMANMGVKKGDITVLDRLAYMGTRGMGALEFKPAKGGARKRMQTPTALQLSSLVEGARKVLKGEFADESSTVETLKDIIRVGVSAGGARAKAVIAWHPETNEIRSSGVTQDNGFEHWLIKLDGVGSDNDLGSGGNYGRIEYAYHLMAKEAGITMFDCRLLEENGRAHFMTKRFDREAGEKHHIQSLCSMSHLDFNEIGVHSYNQYFEAIRGLGMGDDAMQEAFRRMVFNVAGMNNDDHTKNLSFMMKKGQGWSLSPAYDLTFAYSPDSKWTKQHLMSVNDKFTDITRADMLAVADRYLIPDAKRIINEVFDAVNQWESFAQKAGVPHGDVEKIKLNLAEVAKNCDIRMSNRIGMKG